MDPNEFWLLDSVVEQKHPLGLLIMDDVSAIFDRPNHGMERAALSATLANLFEHGLLIASNDERGEFAPNPAEIEAALEGTLDADYGMTEAGGAAWGEVTKPEWERYVDGVFGQIDSDNEFETLLEPIPSMRRRAPGLRLAGERIGEFCCVDVAYLQKFMESIHFRGIAPHVPSIKWSEVKPWRALYWKEFPSAHSARFLGVYAHEMPDEDIPEEYRGMSRWYTSPIARVSES